MQRITKIFMGIAAVVLALIIGLFFMLQTFALSSPLHAAIAFPVRSMEITESITVGVQNDYSIENAQEIENIMGVLENLQVRKQRFSTGQGDLIPYQNYSISLLDDSGAWHTISIDDGIIQVAGSGYTLAQREKLSIFSYAVHRAALQ